MPREPQWRIPEIRKEGYIESLFLRQPRMVLAPAVFVLDPAPGHGSGADALRVTEANWLGPLLRTLLVSQMSRRPIHSETFLTEVGRE